MTNFNCLKSNYWWIFSLWTMNIGRLIVFWCSIRLSMIFGVVFSGFLDWFIIILGLICVLFGGIGSRLGFNLVSIFMFIFARLYGNICKDVIHKYNNLLYCFSLLILGKFRFWTDRAQPWSRNEKHVKAQIPTMRRIIHIFYCAGLGRWIDSMRRNFCIILSF